MDRLKYIVNLVIVALFFCAISISRDGRVGGVAIEEMTSNTSEEPEAEITHERSLNDGTRIINTANLGRDIIGYAGRIPLEVAIKRGVIQSVTILDNSETPSFMEAVVQSGLLSRWDGMTLDDAAQAQVDGVSGSTMSSVAIIRNVQRAAEYGASISPSGGGIFSDLGLKNILGLLVVLLGVAFTIVRPKKKIFEIAQMVLNVGVLGLWCGSFLSMTLFTSWASNGLNLSTLSVTLVLLAVVVLMPLFGRKGSYCHIHCPMGSAQGLLYMLPIPKVKIAPNVVSKLTKVRYYILMLLLFMMWCGVGFELMDYEVFSAFLYSSASRFVLSLAGVFLFLSLFVQRPYCRFICPTGALITIAQKTKA
ncbi:MAG: FMN-binding protein [Rikenellaceae bacterium]